MNSGYALHSDILGRKKKGAAARAGLWSLKQGMQGWKLIEGSWKQGLPTAKQSTGLFRGEQGKIQINPRYDLFYNLVWKYGQHLSFWGNHDSDTQYVDAWAGFNL